MDFEGRLNDVAFSDLLKAIKKGWYCILNAIIWKETKKCSARLKEDHKKCESIQEEKNQRK